MTEADNGGDQQKDHRRDRQWHQQALPEGAQVLLLGKVVGGPELGVAVQDGKAHAITGQCQCRQLVRRPEIIDLQLPVVLCHQFAVNESLLPDHFEYPGPIRSHLGFLCSQRAQQLRILAEFE